MFVLDTNVVSELRKAGDGRADPNVTAWVAGQDAAAFFLSAITVMELEIGVRRVERRDPAQGGALRAWLDEQVLPEFSGRVLPIDSVVALQCARLQVPDPRSDRDALIAATALVHGMAVVTRNVADFRETGVPLVDPWQASSG
jgi:predicted nucleic acid-binding protein